MSNLLQINKLSKAFGQQVLLDEVSFDIKENQKIAVVGRNGAGKSTLFNIITGLDQADSGEVQVLDRTTLGYLKQEDNFQLDEVAINYLMRESDKEEWRCAKIAARFDIKPEQLYSTIQELSGGYRMRLKLTLMLLFEPNLILLDEPTNYLDLSTLLLLEKFLKSYKGSYLIISHDRRFIMNICNEIIEIEQGKANYYPNTLDSYIEFKKVQQESVDKFNKRQEDKKKHLQKFIDRFGAKASKAAQAKSKMKQIGRLETLDVKKKMSSVSMNILPAKSDRGFCYQVKDADIGYGKKVIASNINLYIEKGSHLAILGDNGQGKSTFLKTLFQKIDLLKGSIKTAQNIKVAYYSQYETTTLDPRLSVLSYLMSCAQSGHSMEDIYQIAATFLFRDEDINKKISVLSGGEKARLCLAGIVLNKYDVLLLDEPTNHLDFETAEVLVNALKKSNLTILFISHDRTFVKELADNILEVKNGTIKAFSGDFVDYINYLKNSSQPIKEVKKVVVKKNIVVDDQKKVLAKEIKMIEKQLLELKKEKRKITDKFLKQPTMINIKLSTRHKKIDEEIESLEDKWLEISDTL